MAGMATIERAALSPETFRFFRELARNNRKPWLDANRERYQADVVAPLRGLVEALAPVALSLHGGFETSGRFGANLSRINRDIRFAKDKTPYRTRMYVFFSRAGVADGAELFVGIGADVSVGFRSYGASPRSALRAIGASRAAKNAAWLKSAARRLARRYDSYWYRTRKGRLGETDAASPARAKTGSGSRAWWFGSGCRRPQPCARASSATSRGLRGTLPALPLHRAG